MCTAQLSQRTKITNINILTSSIIIIEIQISGSSLKIKIGRGKLSS